MVGDTSTCSLVVLSVLLLSFHVSFAEDEVVACVNDCKNQNYPAVYPSCDSCSDYVVCSSTGETSVLPCAKNLNFDTVMGACMSSDVASCGVSPTTSPTSMTSPRPSCIESCDGWEDGDYHSCHSCVMYATCYEGIFYSRMCGGGKLWDDEARECSKTSATC